MAVQNPSCVVVTWGKWKSIFLLVPSFSNSERSSCKYSFLSGVDGTSVVLPTVFMYGWGVGASVGFLVGYGYLCCWQGGLWGGGWTGGSIGDNFGVAPWLILCWWICWRIWGGRKVTPCFQNESAIWPVCLYLLQYFLVSAAMVGSVVSFWWDIVA